MRWLFFFKKKRYHPAVRKRVAASPPASLPFLVEEFQRNVSCSHFPPCFSRALVGKANGGHFSLDIWISSNRNRLDFVFTIRPRRWNTGGSVDQVGRPAARDAGPFHRSRQFGHDLCNDATLSNRSNRPRFNGAHAGHADGITIIHLKQSSFGHGIKDHKTAHATTAGHGIVHIKGNGSLLYLLAITGRPRVE